MYTNSINMSAKKRLKSSYDEFNIRSDLNNDETISAVQNAWTDNGNLGVVNVVGDVEIIKSPFPVCLVRNLLPTYVIKSVLAEIPNVHFFEKNNDLYQFKQTADLANIKDQEAICNLYKTLKKDVHGWVNKALANGKNLKSEIAATFSCYEFTDRLLCHDDKCEDRHIAFVLYLTHDWSATDGGNLNLLDTDRNGDPRAVVTSIPALFNTLVLFEVTPTSFHEVSEVVTQTKKRLSLNGWFHCSKDDEQKRVIQRKLDTNPPLASEFTLEEVILVNYLEFKNQLDIKNMFVANSEIELDEFFLPVIWTQICAELNCGIIQWRHNGPPNIRNYEIAKSDALPPQLANIFILLQSRTWLRFLKTITGLDMVPSSNSDTSAWQLGRQPSCKVEIQRWSRGSYTLVHDSDPEFHGTGMDVFLRIPVDCTEPPTGEDDSIEPGRVVYIDKQAAQDEECLLQLGYKMNSLSMVFRDSETLRFTKYLDSTSTPFYQIQCLYIPWAPPEDNPDLKHADSDSENENADSEVEDCFDEEESEISGPEEDDEDEESVDNS